MKPKTEEGLRDLLTQSIQTVSLEDFKSKYDEELYLFVEQPIDLVETAVTIVKDDTEKVQALIDEKKIKKIPSLGLDGVEENAQVSFVIVQPYTLFQLIPGENS